MSDDWQAQERARFAELAEVYRHLLALVTRQYSDLETANPRLVQLAKSYARCHFREEELNEIYFTSPVNCFPIHQVDGKSYPSVSFAVTRFAPAWVLYLPKAREALELVESLKDEKAAA